MSAPNVLFVLSDQHNAKVTGYAGHPNVQTPTLDQLAADGVRFDNAITQNPICTPSRVSFLSGQYCHNHGYMGLSGPNPNGLPSLLGHFRSHGYTTAAIGKIHCPEYWVEDDTDVFREVSPGCSIGGAPEYMAYLERHGAMERHKAGTMAKAPNGKGQLLDGFESPLSLEETQEGFAVHEADTFIRDAHAKGTPFLLHLSFPKPHQVYHPPTEFWNLYDEDSIVLPPNADYEMAGKAPNLVSTAGGFRDGAWTRFEPRTFEAGRLRKLRGYLGCVSQVDYALGQTLQLLEELGIAENTIVIYSSDHGDYAAEHGVMEKAPGICSDAITRIPMLLRFPGRVPAGVVRTEVVEAVDVAPTLCELAGLPPMLTADGGSLTPLLITDGAAASDRPAGEGNAAGWGRAAIPGPDAVHYKPTAGLGVTEFPLSTSVRKGRYRLIIYARERFPEHPDGFTELYDLADDPWEMTNLAAKPGSESIVAELTDALMRWRMQTSRFVTALPSVTETGPGWTHRYKNSVAADGRICAENVRRDGRFHGNYL
jgi:choline-sulfatase/uncharacterized sulfatase